jgi:cobalt-zinc-cadmium efflux system membrane fusion protein
MNFSTQKLLIAFLLQRTLSKCCVLGIFVTALSLGSIYGYAADEHDHADEADHHEDAGAHHDDTEHEPKKGPHNGRMLTDGDFSLELSIVENGIAPEYRVWITEDGKPIAPENVELKVELTRLGGKVDTFSFIAENDYLRGQRVVEEPHSFDVAVSVIYKNQKHHWTFPSYEGRLTLSAETVKQSGITTAPAEAGTLQQHLKTYGRITAKPEQLRHMTARFPGVIRAVNVQAGTQVRAGDVLATIEADESLRSYNITAPIDGIIVSRLANAGETTADKVLFTLVDYRQLTADLFLFPQDVVKVKVGQNVELKGSIGKTTAKISSITPSYGSTPLINARVDFENTPGQWTPGELVNAHITVNQIQVPLRIDNRALQRFRDWHVVFIQVGDTFEIRPLKLGQTDGTFTEVLEGLNSGDSYVIENSYLLKADLEKSGASHDH